ncbi:MAG: hypothetical protein MUC62_02140 [Candidatus Thermoplasmatota archaeon]|jgi:hypothetical protein|nr:hypothetical protein [Candidatus Thermoplasmatota archaeon]
MDALDQNTLGGFKVIPSLAVIKGRPVFVEQGRYSQIILGGIPARTEDVAGPLLERYGTLHYLDILSFRTGEPDLTTIRTLGKMGGELWTDVGARTADPLIDAIMAGATTCMVSTKMMANLSEFASAFELTDGLIVQLDIDGGILSPDQDIREMGPDGFCKEMVDLGITDLVLDIEGSQVDRSGSVRDIAQGLDGKARLYIGMEELSEIEPLRAAGAQGGIISCSKVLKGA